MPYKSEKQRKYFHAHLNSLPKGSSEYNKWKKVVDKFDSKSSLTEEDINYQSNSPLNEIFNSLSSLKDELNEQNKENVKAKNLNKVKQYLKNKNYL